MQLCCSSYTINLISERTNCKYRESNFAQSTGQGGQVKIPSAPCNYYPKLKHTEEADVEHLPAHSILSLSTPGGKTPEQKKT